jgi:hypothetical protein
MRSSCEEVVDRNSNDVMLMMITITIMIMMEVMKIFWCLTCACGGAGCGLDRGGFIFTDTGLSEHLIG